MPVRFRVLIRKQFIRQCKTLMMKGIVLNDKITIIVNLQYCKGFLHWCRKEKEWKYYIILSHLIQIIKKGRLITSYSFLVVLSQRLSLVTFFL